MIDYSNLSTIEELAKFNQTANSEYPQLDASIVGTPLTPIIIQELHPLLTVENLFHCISKDNEVIDTDVLTDRFKLIRSGAVKNMLQDTIIQSINNHTAKSILDDYRIHQSVGNRRHEVAKQGRFVGYEITVSPKQSLAASIDRIGLQLSEAQNVTIYVYHASQNEPIQEIELAYTKAKSMEWFNIFLLLNANDYDYDHYYIGYYEDEIIGNAIYKEIGINSSGCGCQKDDERFTSEFVTAKSVSVAAQHLNGTDIFDVEKAGTQSLNFGINLDIKAVCDYTNFVNNQANSFISYLRQQLTVDFLRVIGYSVENSGASETLKDRALFALTNETQGEEKKLREIIKTFSFDMSRLDSPCMAGSGGIYFGMA